MTNTAKRYDLIQTARGGVRRAYVKLAGGNITSVSAVVLPDKYDERFEIADNGSLRSEYADE